MIEPGDPPIATAEPSKENPKFCSTRSIKKDSIVIPPSASCSVILISKSKSASGLLSISLKLIN